MYLRPTSGAASSAASPAAASSSSLQPACVQPTVGVQPAGVKPAADADTQTKLVQLARRLQEQGLCLSDLFNYYDADRRSAIDAQKWRALVQAVEPTLGDTFSDKAFQVASSNGSLALSTLLSSYNVPADAAQSLGRAVSDSYKPSPFRAIDASTLALAAQIRAWVEPVLMFRDTGLSKDRSISRRDFEHLALATEPQLGSKHVVRLFRQASAAASGSSISGGVDPAAFVQHFDRDDVPAANDSWAARTLRRIAHRAGPMLLTPEQTYRRFEGLGTGSLSLADLERFLRAQEPGITRQQSEALWRLADDGQGAQKMELQAFGAALRRAQLDGEQSKLQSGGASACPRVLLLEVRMTQLARQLNGRRFSLEKAFRLFDRRVTGFLDRAALKQLLAFASFEAAQWEEDEIAAQCDTALDGTVDWAELLRRLKATTAAEPASSSRTSSSQGDRSSSSSSRLRAGNADLRLSGQDAAGGLSATAPATRRTVERERAHSSSASTTSSASRPRAGTGGLGGLGMGSSHYSASDASRLPRTGGSHLPGFR